MIRMTPSEFARFARRRPDDLPTGPTAPVAGEADLFAGAEPAAQTRPRKPRRQPESGLVHACLDLLRARGAFVWRVSGGLLRRDGRTIRLSPPGTPDIVGMLACGRFVGVECKTATGSLQQSQREWHTRAARMAPGAVVLVVRSAGELDAAIKKSM